MLKKIKFVQLKVMYDNVYYLEVCTDAFSTEYEFIQRATAEIRNYKAKFLQDGQIYAKTRKKIL
jgi:hypothetical protein